MCWCFSGRTADVPSIKFTGIAGGKGSGCCGCTVAFVVHLCLNLLSGALVTIKNTGGGSTITSGTTSGVGVVSLTIPSTGTYTVQISKTGITTVSQDLLLTCGDTINIDIGPHVDPLPLTDASGTISLPRIGVSPPTWSGGYFVSNADSAVVTVGPPCFTAGPAGTGDIGICYTVTCNSDGTISVTRAWTIVGDLSFVRHYSRKGAGQTDPCTGIGCLGQDSQKTSVPSSLSPFAWSDSLTPSVGNLLADPVGGTVTLG